VNRAAGIFGARDALAAMLGCLLALAMAVEVQHEFIPVSELNDRLAVRFNDGWDVVFSSFISSNPREQKDEAQMLFVFRKGVP
jgi:hypothetical protein